MTSLFWVDAVKARGGHVDTLVIPYFPGARQDRLNREGDQLFLAKSIANAVNERKFDEVVLLDPHSDVVPALVDRSRVVTIADYIQVPDGKYACVLAPDAGAEKRAAAVAKKLGVPLVHAWKVRDVVTGELTGFDAESFETEGDDDQPGLVVDDICDGGGTFVGLRQTCLVDDWHLLTTHGLYTKGTKVVRDCFSHVYCTDSVPGPRDGVIQIDVCERLLMGDL